MTIGRGTRWILVIAGLVAVAGPAPGEAQRAPAPVAEGYVVTADSVRLFFRVAGAGPDTLVAIHGGPGVDLESIYGDFLPLADRHAVIFYDQRGAGRSTLPSDTLKLTAERQVADLEAVRRHFGLGQMVLVAHSYGPLLAATYALAHPDAVRGMVFFGPVPPWRGDFRERTAAAMRTRVDSVSGARMAEAMRHLADPDPAEDTRQACRDFWAIALKSRLADPASASRLKSDLCASDLAGIRYGLTVTGRVVMTSHGDWDMRPALGQLRVPLLVVHGEAEAIPMDMVAEWAGAVPGARLLRVPGAAHFAYSERPELVWPEVERFLAGLPRK
ncbi:MAG TPA: alpha/beta fold hydrolase [Gemmatimonadales bacterium]